MVPTDRLIEFVWNYEGGDSFALKTHICHIRQKLKLVKEQPGNVQSRCAALAASVHAKPTDCNIQPEGDAVLVIPAGPVVYDVRPDGTTVTVAANAPATTEQLTTFARSDSLGVAN